MLALDTRLQTMLALDTRLQTMQHMLQDSVNSQQQLRVPIRPKKSEHNLSQRIPEGAKKSELLGKLSSMRTQEPVSELVRLISPAFYLYEKNGAIHTALVARGIRELDGLDIEQRRGVIRYLQGLRLLMWLFKRDNYLTTNLIRNHDMSRSPLALQAGITSAWQFSTNLSDLDIILNEHLCATLRKIPWLRHIAWLQYMFNKVSTRLSYRFNFMRLVLERWPSFPLRDGETGIYTLSIPGQLLEDQGIRDIWLLYTKPTTRESAWIEVKEADKVYLKHSHKKARKYREENFVAETDCDLVPFFGQPEIPRTKTKPPTLEPLEGSEEGMYHQDEIAPSGSNISINLDDVLMDPDAQSQSQSLREHKTSHIEINLKRKRSVKKSPAKFRVVTRCIRSSSSYMFNEAAPEPMCITCYKYRRKAQ